MRKQTSAGCPIVRSPQQWRPSRQKIRKFCPLPPIWRIRQSQQSGEVLVVEVVDEVPFVEQTTLTPKTKKVPEVAPAVEVAAEVVAVEVVEAEHWVPSIHKQWKGHASSIISSVQKLGHALTDTNVP